jgi:hypothetical protein
LHESLDVSGAKKYFWVEAVAPFDKRLGRTAKSQEADRKGHDECHAGHRL